MKAKYVIFECENCGALFGRNVVKELDGNGTHIEVEVEQINDEEFPMCECLRATNENAE